jgi:ZIP family zinc transporter
LDTTRVLTALALTLFAGLSTGIGSALAFFTKKTNTKLLSVSLGFSAGVMIYISFVELFSQSKILLVSTLGHTRGYMITITAFFGGILLSGLIDKLVPEGKNPHEIHRVEEIPETDAGKNPRNLYRTGILTALVIGIHNFPEGLATFAAALTSLKFGIPIAVAIAIHNIPEGIAVSVPIYFSTGNRKKAFFYSFMSGLSEPVGAVVGFLILMPFLSKTLFGILYAAVAGIMVFISLDELLPSAREYGEHHLSIYGLVLGMVIMAFSLLFLGH